MDIYSGYNKIHMDSHDQDKITFTTDLRNFFYKVMPFGITNTWTTCQRMMNKMFKYHVINMV